MIKLSPLTLEVKIRYASALLFFISFCIPMFFSMYDPSSELSFIPLFAALLIPLIVIWSMFNRWYFMVTTMILFGIVIFFTVLLGMIWDDRLIAYPEEEIDFLIALVAEVLLGISFGMYLDRIIKQRKHLKQYES